jgi:hypothetical protein
MTILGEQSLAELKDLLAAKDKEFAVITNALASTPQTSWPNTALYTDWMNDWTALQARYNAVRKLAQGDIDTGNWQPVPLSIQPAQMRWNDVIKAIQPVYNTTTKGDLVDVHARLNAVQKIPVYTVPQPLKSSDFEQTVFTTLAPFDPIGDKRAAENWKKDIAIGVGATLVGLLIVGSIYKKL